jgi:hypothetical protein
MELEISSALTLSTNSEEEGLILTIAGEMEVPSTFVP